MKIILSKTRAFAAHSKDRPLAPFEFARREPKPTDIVIEIDFCGVCHSDVHQARDEWGGAKFPMVPGHEVTGRVVQTGSQVTRFKVGDRAGVGCFVDSCGQCDACKVDAGQHCERHTAFTYNGTEMDEVTPTHGGYSSAIVVKADYALKMPTSIEPASAAPLLCAGVTTYAPLKRLGVGAGKRVAVMGLGGLGHMGVQLAAAMGAEVAVFSGSVRKKADALKLGATEFVVKSPEEIQKHQGRYDVILNTISAPHKYAPLLATLRRGGTMVLLGIPPEPEAIAAGELIMGRKSVTGSLIGGIKETQDMLDFCDAKKVGAWVEVLPVSKVNEAFERTVAADVRFRFSLDMGELKP